jgi:sulfite reductase (NADPH) flavoprotein alpha-component
LTVNHSLSRPPCEKDVRHFVINLEGSGLSYRPGDSLGIYPRNSAQLVDETIAQLGLDPETQVTDPKGQQTSFRTALIHQYALNRAAKKFMKALIERIPQGEQRNRLMALAKSDEDLNAYVSTRDYVDILRDFDEAKFLTPEGFLSAISPISPRLYSISSSFQMHPGEVHLTVAVVRYETHGRRKVGLASGFLADQVQLNVSEIPLFVQESHSFRLPDSACDIIMCGPGTGIAPFRAFLEQRILDGATGRNWIFFGEQNRATSFLYEAEFTDYQNQGKLHRLDTAFSRDQAEKIYVQDRIREQGAELWKWLQNGAYFYVCGDAKRMAKDVNEALISVAQAHGGMSPEAAVNYVNVTLMKTEKRYLRDVY